MMTKLRIARLMTISPAAARIEEIDVQHQRRMYKFWVNPGPRPAARDGAAADGTMHGASGAFPGPNNHSEPDELIAYNI